MSNFTCETCGKQYKQKTRFLKHVCNPKDLPTQIFKCEFCKKTLSTESQLFSHTCVYKIRWNDKDTKFAKFGFLAYLRFYELNYRGQVRTYHDFIHSNFYSQFTKFGRYLLQTGMKNPTEFVDFLLKTNQKIADWTSNVVVEEYIKYKQIKEPWEKGLEESVLTMQDWAQRNNMHWTDYFDKVTTPEATHSIRLGKISPWLLYTSEKARSLLLRMNTEQLKLIEDAMDTKRWKIKIMKQSSDIEALKRLITDYKI